MDDLNKFKQAGRELLDKLRFPTYPVAIKFIKDPSEIPEGVMRPGIMGEKIFLCHSFLYARRYGVSVAVTADENVCTPSSVLLRWENLPWEDLVESQMRQGWHKNREAEYKKLEFLKGCVGEEGLDKAADYIGLIASPLHQTRIAPDTVLVYGDGVQITHIVHALCYEFKYPITSSFEGFTESCFKGAFLPFITGKPQLVLAGMGDRVAGSVGDNEIGVGMPADLVFYVLENLFKCGGNLNMGYPPRILMPRGLKEEITPGFQFLRQKIEESKLK